MKLNRTIIYNQTVVVEVSSGIFALQPFLKSHEVYTRLDKDLRCHRSAAKFQRLQHLL